MIQKILINGSLKAFPSGIVLTRRSGVPAVDAAPSAWDPAHGSGGVSVPRPLKWLHPGTPWRRWQVPPTHRDTKSCCSPLPRVCQAIDPGWLHSLSQWQLLTELDVYVCHKSYHPCFWCNSKNRSPSSSEYSVSHNFCGPWLSHICYITLEKQRKMKKKKTPKDPIFKQSKDRYYTREMQSPMS